ncbi:hypothetical protein OFB79_25010, partial [Escherichia coli]|nr:hypothetical protein [Escherichia coli]
RNFITYNIILTQNVIIQPFISKKKLEYKKKTSLKTIAEILLIIVLYSPKVLLFNCLLVKKKLEYKKETSLKTIAETLLAIVLYLFKVLLFNYLLV